MSSPGIQAQPLLYRCAGPNCGVLKGESSEGWWLMWPAQNHGRTVLSLCAWDEEIARREATLHVCGEGCAQKLQSMFMANILGHPHQRQR